MQLTCFIQPAPLSLPCLLLQDLAALGEENIKLMELLEGRQVRSGSSTQRLVLRRWLAAPMRRLFTNVLAAAFHVPPHHWTLLISCIALQEQLDAAAALVAELRAAASSAAASAAEEAEALRAELAAAQAVLQAQQSGSDEAAQRLAAAAAAAEELQSRVAALEAELEGQRQLVADLEDRRAAAAAAVAEAAAVAAHQQELMGQVEGRLADSEAEALALRQQLAERDAQLEGTAGEAAALREVRLSWLLLCKPFRLLRVIYTLRVMRITGSFWVLLTSSRILLLIHCRSWLPRLLPPRRCVPSWRPRARLRLARTRR